MRKLVMGCAVVGLIALSPRSEARSPDLPVPFPMFRCAIPQILPAALKGEIGTASWYGSERQGNTTSSGELFDFNRLTAAHPKLPFGTVVRVTNLKNLESALLKITDRGPGSGGRVIDVSWAAAKELGFVNAGLARVEIDIVSYPESFIRHLTPSRTPKPN